MLRNEHAHIKARTNLGLMKLYSVRAKPESNRRRKEKNLALLAQTKQIKPSGTTNFTATIIIGEGCKFLTHKKLRRAR